MAAQKRSVSKARAKPAAVPPNGVPAPSAPAPAPRVSVAPAPAPRIAPVPRVAPASVPAAPAPAPVKPGIAITTEAIRAKAHELWRARGCRDGFAEQDWADAAALLQAEAAKKSARKI